jgi:hypothetical protein
MFIKEFYAKFISMQETRYVFEAMRRVSRLETRALLLDEEIGWPEWPQIALRGPRMQQA